MGMVSTAKSMKIRYKYFKNDSESVNELLQQYKLLEIVFGICL